MEQNTTRWYRWDDMPKENVSDLLDRRLITGDRMMLSHVYLKKGCIVPQHSHENEQLTYILEGASLILCSRNEKAIRGVSDELALKFGVETLGFAADLSVKGQVEELIDASLKYFGQIDILVTNTGGPPAGKFDELSHDAWIGATRLLLDSVLNLTRLVLPGMKER